MDTDADLVSIKKEIELIKLDIIRAEILLERQHTIRTNLQLLKKQIDRSNTMSSLLECIGLINKYETSTDPIYFEPDNFFMLQLLNCCIINKMSKLTKS